jgi:hypothetical protein
MFNTETLAMPRQLEPFDINEQMLRFLESLPGVQIQPLDLDSYLIEIPQGVEAKQVGCDSNGDNNTWLFRFSPGQVLGHDTEGALPESVWPATEAHWNASTAFEFAQVCYETNLAAGLIPADTPPPDKADDED